MRINVKEVALTIYGKGFLLILQLIAIFVLIGITALFVAAEFAIVKIRGSKLTSSSKAVTAGRLPHIKSSPTLTSIYQPASSGLRLLPSALDGLVNRHLNAFFIPYLQ